MNNSITRVDKGTRFVRGVDEVEGAGPPVLVPVPYLIGPHTQC